MDDGLFNDTDESRVLERVPYLNELMLAIRSVRESQKQGGSGQNELAFLLCEIKNEWYDEIKENVSYIKKQCRINEDELRKMSLSVNDRDAFILKNKQSHVRQCIKQVIDLLDSKKILLLTARGVPTADMTVLYEGDEET